MLLLPSPIWYSANPQGRLTSTQNEFEFARQLLEGDSEEYEDNQSDKAFIQKILSAGTTADKLSTLTLLVQQSPVHNTKALQSLAQLGKKKSRSEALKALRAFADWWTAGGAPDRKLRYWSDQPAKATSDVQRVLFYFEDWLKKLFWDVLQTIERLTLDPLPYVRTQATALVHSLLSMKPEQEHNLLRLLVNKLGDSSKQLASRASYHVLQLLEPHPAMKSVIASEIASLTFRAPLSTSAKVHVEKKHNSGEINSHAHYYATVTLNQLVLSHSEQDIQLARRLVQIYFEMFNFLLCIEEHSSKDVDTSKKPGRAKGRSEMKKDKAKKQEKEERMHRSSKAGKGGDEAFVEIEAGYERLVSAILTGLHRAVPYASLDATGFEKHTNILFKLTHESTFNISLQAMLLIQSLLSFVPRINIQSSDNTKSSLDLATTSSFQSRFLRTLYASLHDPRLRTSSKKPLYLNLLLKAMNRPYHSSSVLAVKHNTAEPKIRRAFWRRLIAVALSGTGMAGENEVVCGSMYILGEVQSRAEELRKIGKEIPRGRGNDNSENSRHADPRDIGDEFDPRKREPEFARADASPIWELTLLSNHYHPSVSLHARQLLDGRAVTTSADLSLNTLSHFLDRFVYKNPKNPTARGSSLMQSATSSSSKKHARDRGVWVGEGAALEKMVNEEQFRRRKVGNIPVDQVFFHRFFSKKHETNETKRKQAGTNMKNTHEDTGDDLSSKGSDNGEEGEEEKEIWKAMQATLPRADEDDEDLMEDDGAELDFSASDASGGEESNEPIEGDEEGWEDADFEFAESDDDLLDSDTVLPEDFLLDPDAETEGEADSEEWGGVDSKLGQKRKTNVSSIGTHVVDDGKTGRKKKQKLGHLPIYASLEDYEKLINQTPEDNI